jgi:predicted ABC-class ATPase
VPTGEIHLHRVVDDQVHGHERLDDLGILAQLGDGASAWRRDRRAAARR